MPDASRVCIAPGSVAALVASGFLLLLVPALFFGKGRHHARQRVSWLVGAAGVYFLALFFGQQVPGVPRLVFDGSSVGEILHLMSSFALPGPEKEQLVEHVGRQASWWSNLAWGIPYVLFAALGLFIPLVVLLAVVLLLYWLYDRLVGIDNMKLS